MSSEARVYVGNLPGDVRREDLEKVFDRYGRVRAVDVKGGRDSAAVFAFVEYDDPRDAADAVRTENGQPLFAGSDRMRVEVSRGRRDRDGFGGRDRYDDRGGYGRDRYDDRGRGRDRYDDRDDRRRGLGPSPYGPSRKTDYQVEVSGLEPTMSWQDLKDHFREHRLEVTHADVHGNGNGTVMFSNQDDMEAAIDKVDGTSMRNMRGECIVTVQAARRGTPGGRRDRSRSPRRDSPPRRRSVSPRGRSPRRSLSPGDRSPPGRGISRSRSPR